MMLYGEINVFSPPEAQRLLRRAADALLPGGVLVLEMQTPEHIRGLAQANGWSRHAGGLFSDGPHLCLTESRWFESYSAVRQVFHVVHAVDGKVETLCGTTRAWSDDELSAAVGFAGFGPLRTHNGWPCRDGSFRLLSCVKEG